MQDPAPLRHAFIVLTKFFAGPTDSRKARQVYAHTTSNSQTPHRIYHVLPSTLHSGNSRARLQRASLQHMQSTMRSRDISKRSLRECESVSITSMRRSVSGMKQLLPLKLSPQLSEDEWPSPASNQRSTFGFPIYPPGANPSILQRRSKKKYCRPPMTIRPNLYRDTPIYTEPGSPLLGRAYYTDEDVCFNCSPPGSSCDESCIFHDYESSSEAITKDEVWGRQSEGGSAAPKMKDVIRSSELSFKCLGESPSYSNSLFRNEGAWLSSSRKGSKSEPPLSAMVENRESWLNDSIEDEELSCATALAPAKAHVIDVNSQFSSPAIPTRSSSFAGTKSVFFTASSGRQSRLSFRDSPPMHSYFSDSWSDDEDDPRPRRFGKFESGRLDLAMSSPPISPKWPDTEISTPATSQESYRITTFQPNSEDPITTSFPDSTTNIISVLEQSTSNFPSAMLLLDTPCISLIRIKLHQSRSSSVNISRSTSNNHNCHHRSMTGQKTTQSLHEQRQQTPSQPFETPDFASVTSSHPTYDQLPQPNLKFLNKIFPNSISTSTPFLLSALYAHLLAYSYIASLTPTPHISYTQPRNPQPQSQSPIHHISSASQNPRPNQSHQSSHPKTHPLSQSPTHTHEPMFERANIPQYTTNPHSLPSKAAEVLGATALNSVSRGSFTVRHDAISRNSGSSCDTRFEEGLLGKRAEEVMGRLRDCMGWLIGEITGEGDGVDGTLLRALVEVVMGCEREVLGG